jgi:hypothetical protein
VRNMVVTHRGNLQVDFYAFPNKLWRWMDDRETSIGLAVEMHNLEKELAYLTYPDDPKSPRSLEPSGRGSIPLRRAQLYYLLETQWLKPVPIGTAKGEVGSRKVDVLQTLVNDNRVDFYFDQVTHLPLKISFPKGDSPGNYYVTFSDYISVKDIQMPKRVSFMGTGKLLTNFQLNVDYDEMLFERPPSIQAGNEDWKKKL